MARMRRNDNSSDEGDPSLPHPQESLDELLKSLKIREPLAQASGNDDASRERRPTTKSNRSPRKNGNNGVTDVSGRRKTKELNALQREGVDTMSRSEYDTASKTTTSRQPASPSKSQARKTRDVPSKKAESSGSLACASAAQRPSSSSSHSATIPTDLSSTTVLPPNEVPGRYNRTSCSLNNKRENPGKEGTRLKSNDAHSEDVFDPVESSSDRSDGETNTRYKHKDIETIDDSDDEEEAPPIKPGSRRKNTAQRPVFKMPPGMIEPTGTRRQETVDLSGPPKKKSAKNEELVKVVEEISDFEGEDRNAILRFTPPRPHKNTPYKLPMRPCTPPSQQRPPSPSPPLVQPQPAATEEQPASPSKPRLKSPSKKTNPIPPTPHRESIDAFWRADFVNHWNETHSPRKTLKVSPQKLQFSSGGGGRRDGGNVLGFGAGDLAELLDDDASSPTASPSRSRNKKGSSGEGVKSASPTKKRQQSTAQKATLQARKDFDKRKEAMAISFVQELDERITGGEVGRLSAETGGIVIVWSKKLNSTAGRANWRREVVRSSSSLQQTSQATAASTVDANTSATYFATTPQTSSQQSPQKQAPQTHARHRTTIELATKIIDSPHRLHNVLAHEYCHLANFTISRVLDNPHGASFKGWARKVTREFGGSHGVEVTTKHDYEIEYKFAWVCIGRNGEAGEGGDSTGGGGGRKVEAGSVTAQSSRSPASEPSEDTTGCGMLYQRHSRSVDVSRHGCGRCRGKLLQIRPKPRAAAPSHPTASTRLKGVDGGRPGKEGGAVGAGIGREGGGGTREASDRDGGKRPTVYQSFVKDNYATVKKDLPQGSPMKDVMREVGARYREGKNRKEASSRGGETGDEAGGLATEKKGDIEVVEILDTDDEEDSGNASSRGIDIAGVEGVAKKLDFLRL